MTKLCQHILFTVLYVYVVLYCSPTVSLLYHIYHILSIVSCTFVRKYNYVVPSIFSYESTVCMIDIIFILYVLYDSTKICTNCYE